MTVVEREKGGRRDTDSEQPGTGTTRQGVILCHSVIFRSIARGKIGIIGIIGITGRAGGCIVTAKWPLDYLPFHRMTPEQQATWKSREAYEKWVAKDQWAGEELTRLFGRLDNEAFNDLAKFYNVMGKDERFRYHGTFSNELAFWMILHCARRRGYLNKPYNPQPPPSDASDADDQVERIELVDPDEEAIADEVKRAVDSLDCDELSDDEVDEDDERREEREGVD